jgi:hypothetical protein
MAYGLCLVMLCFAFTNGNYSNAFLWEKLFSYWSYYKIKQNISIIFVVFITSFETYFMFGNRRLEKLSIIIIIIFLTF